MNKPFAATAVLAVAMVSSSARAEETMQMRPGLWENHFTVKSQSGDIERSLRQMQEQLASLPPEQRQMMEQMMADQGMQIGAGGQSVKVCISKEQAERGMVPQQEGNCRQDLIERTRTTLKYRFSCSGNPPSSGEGEVTIISPTAYSGKAIVNTMVQGKPEHMTMEQTGKWISSDCGNLKPR
jgi:hypothetical protein